MEKKTTEGKVHGKLAFRCSEAIAMIFLLIILIDYGIYLKIVLEYWTALCMYQSGILTITWGAKASSNFRKKDKKQGTLSE